MIHYVYVTTNAVNGKRYIGKHSFKSLPNRYLGSGHGLKAAITKYGRENFYKEVVSIHNTEDEAYEAEKLLVELLGAIRNPLFYNRVSGGRGGAAERTLPEDHKRKIGDAHRGKKRSDEARRNMSAGMKGRKSWHKGKKKSAETVARMKAGRPKDFKHTEETKKRISEQYQGSKHPAYGMMWITNGIENRRVTKWFVVEHGWRFGKRPYKHTRNEICLG